MEGAPISAESLAHPDHVDPMVSVLALPGREGDPLSDPVFRILAQHCGEIEEVGFVECKALPFAEKPKHDYGLFGSRRTEVFEFYRSDRNIKGSS
jgi:hypothetical protein